jgi:curved DNA-binding protein CbpA
LKNYYDILGIPQNATKEQIKSAYRKLSIKFHPDKNNGEQFFESMFKNINEAHEILSDDWKRTNYDFQLKKYSEAKSDISRREEEIRRKQEELLRKEQELRKREFHRESVKAKPPKDTNTINPQNFTETNWGRVINFFLVLNAFLILLICITPRSDDYETQIDENRPDLKKETRHDSKSGYQKSTVTKKIISDNNEVSPIDVSSEIQKSPDEEIQSTVQQEVEEIVTDEYNLKDNEQIDSKLENPKWFQFKKKRELKKKNKED